jgi:hypothetical protein
MSCRPAPGLCCSAGHYLGSKPQRPSKYSVHCFDGGGETAEAAGSRDGTDSSQGVVHVWPLLVRISAPSGSDSNLNAWGCSGVEFNDSAVVRQRQIRQPNLCRLLAPTK